MVGSSFLLPQWGSAPEREETKAGGFRELAVPQDCPQPQPASASLRQDSGLVSGQRGPCQSEKGKEEPPFPPLGPKVALSFYSFWAFSRE